MEPMSERSRKKTAGRRKIPIQKIQDKSKRHVAFSKRRMGLFKKASELCTLCDSEIAIITFSEAGKIFTFGHPSADSVIQRYIHGSNHEMTSSFSSSSPPLPSFHSDSICNQINNCVAQTISDDRSKPCEQVGRSWWESGVDSLGLEEVRLYAKSLEVLRNNIVARAASMASSSPDVALETAMVYPCAMNVSDQGTEFVSSLQSGEPRNDADVNGVVVHDKAFDGLELVDFEELDTEDVESIWNAIEEPQLTDSLRWEDAESESMFWEEVMNDGDVQSDLLTTWWA